jgi:hypothetical protein
MVKKPEFIITFLKTHGFAYTMNLKKILSIIGLAALYSFMPANSSANDFDEIKNIRNKILVKRHANQDKSYTAENELEDYRKINQLNEGLRRLLDGKAPILPELEAIDREADARISDLEQSLSNIFYNAGKESGRHSYENREKTLKVILEFIDRVEKDYSYDPKLQARIIDYCIDNQVLTLINYSDTMAKYEQRMRDICDRAGIPCRINKPKPIIPQKRPLELYSDWEIIKHKAGYGNLRDCEPKVEKLRSDYDWFRIRGGNPYYFHPKSKKDEGKFLTDEDRFK